MGGKERKVGSGKTIPGEDKLSTDGSDQPTEPKRHHCAQFQADITQLVCPMVAIM